MIHTATHTDIGKRSGNEDALFSLPLPDGSLLLAVADGMGGHNAGEVASRLALETLQEYADAPFDEAFEACNLRVYAQSLCDRQCFGMGTTLVAARADARNVAIAYVGDSRIYHWDGITLRQRSADHSYVAELVRRRLLTPEEARHHPHRNRITRAIGGEPTVDTDYRQFAWAPGDMLLLCSDGLHDVLTDAEIAAILSEDTDLDTIAETLIREALQADASDNISVVLARNGGDGE
ncbi:MAG: protein phosphatase 2C domain-containing protein [Clostridiales bacterium]|nr:protein phosphatase 2C domain-containing protein [Clostridiales bacterium]